MQTTRAYEWRAVSLMAFGFALVNFDRFMLFPLFPVVMKDLHLDYQQLGWASSAIAVTWGISSMIAGRLADRRGRRGILAGSVLAFSVLCGATGLVGSVGALLMARGLMGVFEGAYTPISIAATVEASPPQRVGRNVGIHQFVAPLFGVGVAPILVTQLLHWLSWRWVFLVTAVPGLLCALLIRRVIVDPPELAQRRSDSPRWSAVFRYRNVVLNLVGFSFWLSPLLILIPMMPNYLTDHLHLSLQSMGYVMSGVGWGGATGMILIPALSDRVGRKAAMLVSLAGCMVLLLWLMRVGADLPLLFALLFGISILSAGNIACAHAVTVDAVPSALFSTATGLVIGVGEMLGGGLVPSIAGTLAQTRGIQIILPVALIGTAVGLIVILLQQSVPRRLAPY